MFLIKNFDFLKKCVNRNQIRIKKGEEDEGEKK
jgi:hypothetical protein